MKAYIIEGYGKDTPLILANVAQPKPSTTQVLVKIHAAGVNALDAKIKDGAFKQILKYKLPLTLGNDLAGVVTAVGASVAKFKIGDGVYARPNQDRIGTFAEFIAIDEQDLAMKPKNLTMEQAAGVPLVALTAWQALVEKAQLKRGQKIFIQAGSGGVGTIAIQLAKQIGATVATTTSEANRKLVTDLGADVVIDYKTTDFEDVLKDYDVVLHSQDTANLEKSFRILKPGGRLISISGPPDPSYAQEAKLPALLKIVIKGLSYKARKSAKKYDVHYSFLLMQANGQQLSEITTLIESSKIKPVIDTVYPFTKTPEALQYVESGRAKGKVVISIKK